jgi:hypothetical protein
LKQKTGIPPATGLWDVADVHYRHVEKVGNLGKKPPWTDLMLEATKHQEHRLESDFLLLLGIEIPTQAVLPTELPAQLGVAVEALP